MLRAAPLLFVIACEASAPPPAAVPIAPASPSAPAILPPTTASIAAPAPPAASSVASADVEPPEPPPPPPVACSTWHDCSWKREPGRARLIPVSSKEVPRPKPKVVPCKTGEYDSVCNASNVCEIVAWGC